MCECKLLLFGAFVMCNVILVTSFNIDQFNYATYTGNSSTMFGFTVAVHKDRRNMGWVLVGAPEEQSQFQSRAYRGGAVYKCPTDADSTCQEILFSRESYNKFGNTVLDEKSHQWFGATLSSSGRIVACAPRYVWFTKDLNRRDPVGTCYIVDENFQNSEEYSPCRTMNWGYHRQGSCQAGFSAGIDKIGKRLFIGAPGNCYWQGSVYQHYLAERDAVFSTREGRAQDDDSYMGYSTVVGDFLEGQKYEGVAVGMPRGNGLRGKVLLFTWDLKNYKNLTASHQIGAYFGYSITAADVNGDGRTDIIVGAPMHTEPNKDFKYDVGRVYIFIQTGDFATSFSNYTFIDGMDSRSRFGHAVSTLGDLNQDGYDDFAVGAPYGGLEGRGAVYLYYGSKNGIVKKSEQVIYGKNINTNIPITTFGFSITGGLDLDNNSYPDMAVGAYLSNTAFFFRAQPVAVVDAYVRFRTTQKQIDIKKKNCKLANDVEAICTDVDFCMKYTGKEIPSQLYFRVEYILDSKKPNATRMGFVTRDRADNYRDTLLLYKDKLMCTSERVYIKSDIRDKLTPLVAEMKYSIVFDTSSSDIYRNPRSHLRPALDLNSPPSRKDSLVIQKNCGSDNVCIPDLVITTESNVKKYLLGSQNNLEFDVVVSNFGEDSFETTYEMKIPKGIFLKKVESKPGMVGALCSPPGDEGILSCEIGNPLQAGKIASFKIILQPTYQEQTAPSYEFDMYVNSTNPERNSTMANNHRHVSIDIWIDASLELTGKSYPSTVYYNESHYTSDEIVKENDIGPQVTHVYYVKNSGPATIQEAEVFLLWPMQTLGGEDLLYLLDTPHTEGNVKCDNGMANYKNYIVGYHGDSIFDRLRIHTADFEKVQKQTGIETENGVKSGPGVENINVPIENDVLSVSTGDSSILTGIRRNNSNEINTSGTINVDGQFAHTVSRSKTVSINGEAHTTWENTTVVKDGNGHILRTYYSNNDPEYFFDNFTGTNFAQGDFRNVQNNAGEFTHTDSQAHTVWINGKARTTWRNTTIVKDANGNVLRTYYANDDPEHYFNNFTGTSLAQGGFIIQQNNAGEFAHTESESRTVWINGKARTTWRNTTVVKDANGNVLRTYYSNDDPEHYFNNFTGTSFAQGDFRIQQNNGGEFAHTESESRTVWINGKARTTWRNTTVVKDANGNVLRTYYANDDPDQYFNNYTDSKFTQGSFGGAGWNTVGGSSEVYWSREQQEIARQAERNRQLEQKRIEEQNQQNELRRQQEHQKRLQEQEAWRTRQEEERRRQQDERRRQEDERRRQEEEERQRQGGYDEEEEYYEEDISNQNAGWQSSTVEERQRKGGHHQQGGVQESGSQHRVPTGYYDQQGHYHDYPRDATGRVIYNKTYTVESAGSIPVDISGGQSGQHLGFDETSLGNGFTVQTLDLGNAASESSIYGSQGGGSSQSENGALYGAGSGSSSGFREELYRQNQGAGQSGSWHVEGSYSRSGQIPPTIVHNNVERDNVATDRPSPYARSRGKRAINEMDPYREIAGLVKCNATKCNYIRCVVGVLDKDKEVAIALRSRLNVREVNNLTSSQAIKISSMIVARISKLHMRSESGQILKEQEVFTEIPAKEAELVPEVAPLWIYVVSAVAGVVMLLLLIWILSKCGFFKRNRPASSSPERQPLSRNGYHSGDEAL